MTLAEYNAAFDEHGRAREGYSYRPTPASTDKIATAAGISANQVADLLRQNQDLLERLEALERGGTRFIESEPQQKPTVREANPESVSPFTARLLAHTHDAPRGVIEHEPAYNVPLRTYLRRDGDFVRLQGDAKNRAMYTDQGLYCLTPEEEADYLKNERPGIVRFQQTRAALINGLRQLVKREATLSGYIDDVRWGQDLEDMSIERLEEEWHNLCRQTSNPDRRLPTAERHRAEQEPLLQGVETGGAIDELQRKMAAPGAQTRTIEVTQANAHMFS